MHILPKLFKDVFPPFVLNVFQPLLGAVLLHSLWCKKQIVQEHRLSCSLSLVRGDVTLDTNADKLKGVVGSNVSQRR